MYYAYLETDRKAKAQHDENMKKAAAERRNKKTGRVAKSKG